MIIPIYQTQGQSSHLLAQAIGKKYHTKATHTGTLDPMAEGVLIVLTDQDRFNKSKYADWKKTYQFEILFGFSTDSHDLLGITTDQKNINLPDEKSAEQLKVILPHFMGKQRQLIPTFSAKRVNGKSGFDIGKKGDQLNHEQRIEIFNIHFNQLNRLSGIELLTQIKEKIKKVKGDFRQQDILDNWQTTLTTEKFKTQKFVIAQLTAQTSKRTYIRGLVRDISQKMELPATTFSIIRTQNGPYTIKDCRLM